MSMGNGVNDIIQPISQTIASMSDANGTVTFTFPAIPVSQDWIVSINVAEAPSTGVFMAETQPDNLGSWTAGNTAGPFKAGSNTQIVVYGFACLPNTTYQCIIIGEAVTSGSSPNVFPYPSTSTVITQNQAGLRSLNITAYPGSDIGTYLWGPNTSTTTTISTVNTSTLAAGPFNITGLASTLADAFIANVNSSTAVLYNNPLGTYTTSCVVQLFNTQTQTLGSTYTHTVASSTGQYWTSNSSISPNGKYILFQWVQSASPYSFGWSIFNTSTLTWTDGTYTPSGVTQAGGLPTYTTQVSWSPDSSIVTFYVNNASWSLGYGVLSVAMSAPTVGNAFFTSTSTSNPAYLLAFDNANIFYIYAYNGSTATTYVFAVTESTNTFTQFNTLATNATIAGSSKLNLGVTPLLNLNNGYLYAAGKTTGIFIINQFGNSVISTLTTSSEVYGAMVFDNTTNPTTIYGALSTGYTFRYALASTTITIGTTAVLWSSTSNSGGSLAIITVSTQALTTPPAGYAYRILTVTAYNSSTSTGTIALATNSNFTTGVFDVQNLNTTQLLNGRLIPSTIYATTTATTGITLIEIAYDLVYYDLTQV